MIKFLCWLKVNLIAIETLVSQALTGTEIMKNLTELLGRNKNMRG